MPKYLFLLLLLCGFSCESDDEPESRLPPAVVIERIQVDRWPYGISWDREPAISGPEIKWGIQVLFTSFFYTHPVEPDYTDVTLNTVLVWDDLEVRVEDLVNEHGIFFVDEDAGDDDDGADDIMGGVSYNFADALTDMPAQVVIDDGGNFGVTLDLRYEL
ncbi:MAG: hypothetical protein AAF433_11080 [Bacteroidota bacterium]